MKNKLFIKGAGVYGVLQNYIDEFAQGFRELGYNTVVIELLRGIYENQWKEILEKYEIYATIDCFGAQVVLGMAGAYDKSVVQLTYLCDHPLYGKDCLPKVPKGYIAACFDREHVAFLKEYYPKLLQGEFIPLAGKGADVCKRYKKRKIDVLFTGTYIKPTVAAKKPESGDGFETIFRFELQQKLLNEPFLSLEKAVKMVLNNYPIEVSNEEFLGVMYEIKDIGQYVRNYFRDKIVRTILAAGIKLSVFGDGWQELDCEGIENLTILEGDIHVARQTLGDVKIALNIMPWVKDGFQERIAAGMLSGAVVFTDTSKYIEEEFTDGYDIMLYHLDNIEELPLRMKEILADDAAAEKIAENGKKIAEENHTWKNRVKKMAELIEEAHERMRCENENCTNRRKFE